jgi:phage tail-like protein
MNPFDLRTIDVCHNFAVFIGGLPVGEFHAVEGLTRSVETKAVSEGGRFEQQVHMIKQHTFGELTLKWGLVQRGYMYNWMEEVKPGNRFRRDLVIMLQDRMLIPTRVFSIIGAFPTEWTSPNMDAQSSIVPVETLKLRYHSMEMVARHVI